MFNPRINPLAEPFFGRKAIFSGAPRGYYLGSVAPSGSLSAVDPGEPVPTGS